MVDPYDGEREELPAPSYDDLERLMFHFWTPITIKEQVPAPSIPEPAPQIGTGRQEPKGEGFRKPPVVALPAVMPAWQRGGFWGESLPKVANSCATWYETWRSVFTFQVPQTKLFVTESLSLGFPVAREQFEVYEVRVLRNTEEMARWEECVVAVRTTAGPNDTAASVVFGGHLNPVPFMCRFSPNDTITVQVKGRGREPFSQSPSQIHGTHIELVLDGWLNNLIKPIEGRPEPIDLSLLRHMDGRPVVRRADVEITKALIDYLRMVQLEDAMKQGEPDAGG